MSVMKYNFGLIKNREIGFHIKQDDKIISFHSILKNVKQEKNVIRFIFEDSVLNVSSNEFMFLKIREENGIVWFIQKDNDSLSGYVGFSLFDTYGFPIELTEELLCEKGKTLDYDGFEILRKLQKEKSSGTFKNNTAFA